MKRGEFIRLLGGAATWPFVAQGQQMPMVGFLNSGSSAGREQLLAAFRQGLSETDHVEGRNVAIEYRWAEGRYERLPALAADLAQRPARSHRLRPRLQRQRFPLSASLTEIRLRSDWSPASTAPAATSPASAWWLPSSRRSSSNCCTSLRRRRPSSLCLSIHPIPMPRRSRATCGRRPAHAGSIPIC
jgi:hypothetical protein